MKKLEASQTRIPAEVFHSVAREGERVMVTHRNGGSLALISKEDLAFLEEAENLMDLEESRKALKENGRARPAADSLGRRKA